MGSRRQIASFLVALLVITFMPAYPARAASLVSLTLANAGSAVAGDFAVTITGPTSGVMNISVTKSGSQELSGTGVTTSSTFTIVVDVGVSFTPVMTVGSGQISDWTWDAGTQRMTIKASPEAISFTNSCTIGGSCPDAVFDFKAMLSFGVGSSDLAQGNADLIAFFDDYKGGYVATDAQTFSMPTFDKATKALSFDLGAPHLTKGPPAVQNEGFFNILIPKPVVINQWGLTFDQNSPPSIGATSDGAAVTLQTPVYVAARGTFPEGWLLKSNTIHYSTPKIALKPGAASVAPAPTEFDASNGTLPASTDLPVLLPLSGELKREVTLKGAGATLVLPEGTRFTLAGEPFDGRLQPPKRVFGATQGGLSDVVSLKAVRRDGRWTEDVVFDPPVKITLAGSASASSSSEGAAASRRVVRIAPDGAITDVAGTVTAAGTEFDATRLGTYGLATVLGLASIKSAPSIDVALPIDLPDDGIIAFPTTLRGAGASIAFPAGTVAIRRSGLPFAGTIKAPAAATGSEGVGSAVSITAGDGEDVFLSSPATVTLTPPDGVVAADVAPVAIGTNGSITCLAGTAAGSALSAPVAATGTYGLALPLAPAAAASGRAFASEGGTHARWDGQSAQVALCPGQAATLTLRLRNTGSTTWGPGSPVVIAAPDGTAIDSGLVPAPLYGTRLATSAEPAVGPGETGTFAFKVRAPAASGAYRIDVRAVAEGVAWLEDEGVYLPVTVR